MSTEEQHPRRSSQLPPDLLHFAALIAHQMKSPVTSIGSLLNTLLDGTLGELSPSQRDFVWRARTRCDEAIAAGRRLFEIAAPAPSGDLPEATDVAAVVDRFIASLKTAAAERSISVSVSIGRPARALIRESALVEALLALANNAIKYTPVNGTIRFAVQPDGDRLALVVEDSGMGVPKEDREKIFLQFFRSKSAAQSQRPGIGLGLFFVKAVVESAGGTVAVDESELGGARFTVRLLLTEEPPSEIADNQAQRPLRVVVVGGAAAGPKVASRVSRLDPTAEVVVIERGRQMAFAGCGLPYYVSGVVHDRQDLMSTAAGAVRDPIFFQDEKRANVRLRTEAAEIDRTRKRLLVRDVETREENWLPYDALVLATGARAKHLDLPGESLPNIYTLHGLDDADGIKRALASWRALDVAVVGGGLLGVEITEALVAKGSRVTIVESAPQILSNLDEEIARLVERQLESHGVRVLTQTAVRSFDGDKMVERVITDRGPLKVDMVILAAGIEPNVDLARRAGLEIGPSGGIRVDDEMRTSDSAIFAAGDCVETFHQQLKESWVQPMGSTANKQGRVAAGNACGRHERFQGVLGTAVCRVFDWCVARTGLTEAGARAAGYRVVSALVPGPDRAHYMPDSRPLYLKMVADADTRKLLGVQALGPGAADKRVDVAATAISLGATVDAMANLDLAYAPPYAEALDNLLTASNVVRNKLDGLLVGISPFELKKRLRAGESVFLLDVRSPSEYARVRLPGSTLVPLGALRSRMQDLPRDRDIVAFCNLSLRGYEAQVVLRAAGFERVFVLDGGLEMWPYEKVFG